MVGYEALTRRAINPVWVARLNAIGFGLLMLLMIAVTYNDILRLL
jgi:regulator of sigma E protease